MCPTYSSKDSMHFQDFVTVFRLCGLVKFNDYTNSKEFCAEMLYEMLVFLRMLLIIATIS